MLAFEVRGWEMVIAQVSPALLERLRPLVGRLAVIAHDRYALEIPASSAPEQLLADVVAGGATLISLNPVRQTLEEFFVKQVAAVPSGGRP
jgi:hypothetical protein